jgi:hypothetical protein
MRSLSPNPADVGVSQKTPMQTFVDAMSMTKSMTKEKMIAA